MPIVSYGEAAKQAILEEMRADRRVFVMGEDIQASSYADVLDEFGPERIRSTPISEAGFFGAGIGAALTGTRPIIEGGYSTFVYSAMDQVANQAAKSRYMFGGQASVPLVIRLHVAYTGASAAHHSDRPWGLFSQVPGLKIIVPTTPFDVKGMLKSALRDGNPILCFDDSTLVGMLGEVPAHEYTVPLGKADVKRVGSDVTVVGIGGAVHQSLAASRIVQEQGVSVEVIDVRTLVPLDEDTVLQSVMKTGRLIVVDPAPRMGGFASEVAALVAEAAFAHLKAPIVRLTAPHIPVPFSPALEALMYPTADRIVAAIHRVLEDSGTSYAQSQNEAKHGPRRRAASSSG